MGNYNKSKYENYERYLLYKNRNGINFVTVESHIQIKKKKRARLTIKTENKNSFNTITININLYYTQNQIKKEENNTIKKLFQNVIKFYCE